MVTTKKPFAVSAQAENSFGITARTVLKILISQICLTSEVLPCANNPLHFSFLGFDDASRTV